MKYSCIFIIYFSCIATQTIVKLRAGMGAGREGQNQSFIAQKYMYHLYHENVLT